MSKISDDIKSVSWIKPENFAKYSCEMAPEGSHIYGNYGGNPSLRSLAQSISNGSELRHLIR